MTSKSSLSPWAIGLIVLLLALNAYQWYSNSQLKKDNSNQHTELLELEKVQAELDKDYQDALASIESLRDDNKELGALIDNQKSELAAQKEKINNLIWTKRELGKAKEAMASLQKKADDFLVDLTALKKENALLATENKNLSEERDVLSTSLSEERKLKSELAEAKAVLVSQKESLEATKEILDTKVAIGSAIKINFMQVEGFEVKDDGKIKKKSKAKDVDMLRICFKTETNMVTPGGDETFYIRYIDPMGETIALDDSGSGVLTNKLENTQVRYSSSGKIVYNNEDTDACIDWVTNYPLVKGDYEVEMYNKGFMVGKGTFKLK